MTTLRSEDVAWAIRHCPLPLLDLMRANPQLIVAGGFLRAVIAGEEISDIDCVTTSFEEAERLAKSLHEAIDASKRGYFVTDNAITVTGLKYPVQFIHRWTYATAQGAIDSFDFTIAMAAIYFEGGSANSVCHPDFYSDLAAKRLVYCAPERDEDAGGSMLRVIKFARKGYHVPIPTLSLVAARFVAGVGAAVNTRDEPALAEQLSGLLIEVDPAPLA